MKRLSFVLFMTLSGSLLIQSCKQADKTNTPVPKDALVAMHINNTSLSGKLSWQEIKATNWFKEAYAEAPDSLLRKLMDDPDNSGMDTKADMMMFIKKQGQGGYLAFEGTLKDAKAFEAFNKKVSDGGNTIKDGETTFINIKNQGTVAWQGTKFVYIMDVPLGNMSGMIRGSGFAEPYKFTVDSLHQFAKATFAISAKNSLGNDDRFAALMKEPGDLHFWINNEEYIASAGGEALSSLKVADLFQGNVTASTLNFDNGKITVKGKSYLNEKWAKIYKNHPPKKIDADVINRIPSQNVVAVLALNYSPEGLKEIIKLSGLDGIANGFLEKANYSIDEFVKANKGDLVVAISDFQVKKKESPMPDIDDEGPANRFPTMPSVKVLFATSVNDKAAFDKLITTLSQQMGEQKEMMGDINYQINNNWFAASNSPDDVSKFLAGGNNKHTFTSKLTDQSFGIYVDLQKIMTNGKANISDTSDATTFNQSIKMWQDILITGGDFKDGAVISYAELNLVDKNVNSLKQLNQYLDKISGSMKRKHGALDGTRSDNPPSTSN